VFLNIAVGLNHLVGLGICLALPLKLGRVSLRVSTRRLLYDSRRNVLSRGRIGRSGLVWLLWDHRDLIRCSIPLPNPMCLCSRNLAMGGFVVDPFDPCLGNGRCDRRAERIGASVAEVVIRV
jgi:hypothetical protein